MSGHDLILLPKPVFYGWIVFWLVGLNAWS